MRRGFSRRLDPLVGISPTSGKDNMTYKILKAKNGKTVLVHEDSFEGEASDYFVGGIAAEVVGEVEIDGDTDELADIYESQM